VPPFPCAQIPLELFVSVRSGHLALRVEPLLHNHQSSVAAIRSDCCSHSFWDVVGFRNQRSPFGRPIVQSLCPRAYVTAEKPAARLPCRCNSVATQMNINIT
jgi:hypothetical protein